jgi:hypothetical protein
MMVKDPAAAAVYMFIMLFRETDVSVHAEEHARRE